MQLLQQLVSIATPPGNEKPMRDFLVNYFQNHAGSFKSTPKLIYGDKYQDCLAVIFGTPRIAVFAHMDTVAYMSRYGNELIPMGSPHGESGSILSGADSQGVIECTLKADEYDENDHLCLQYEFNRPIDRGTELTYKVDYREDEEYVQSAYLDNRVGIWNALKLAEEMDNMILVFSCWEEHYGGSTIYMGKFVYEEFGIQKVLISDITYVTPGIKHGDGAVISIRDSGIPRRDYVNRIISLAKESGIPYQLEVECYGGSDGNELQRSPYPINWCFVGAPVNNMHTPNEKLLKSDLQAMLEMYKYLLPRL
jgi:putative aminopeptidase FrvX